MAFKTAPCFVDSIWEVFGPLLAGVPLLVVPQATSRRPAEVSHRGVLAAPGAAAGWRRKALATARMHSH